MATSPIPEGKSINLDKPPGSEKQEQAPLPELVETEDMQKLARLGDRYLEENRLQDALLLFEKILASESKNDPIHFKVALIHFQMGDIEKALEEMKKAASLNPRHTGYRYNLGLVLSEVGRLKEAVSEWKKVLEVEPENESVRMLIEMFRQKL